jgi:hypothetical protein
MSMPPRRQQEPATDPEQARKEAHCAADSDQEKEVHREFGDRQVDLQQGSPR